MYHIRGTTIPVVDSARDLGVIVDPKLKFHAHIQSISSKASGLSCNILRSTSCRSREFMITLYIAHIRPLLEFSSCVWNSGYVGDLKLLEGVQRRWTKQIQELDELPYWERLRTLDLYSVKGRLLRYDIIKYWKIFHNQCSISPEDIFVPAPQISTRGHCYKLSHILSVYECRKRFFSVRAVSLWNSLPADVVQLESLNLFKAEVHSFLGDRLYEYHD